MTGILVIDKPQLMTSHDVVVSARSALGMKRVGHAGTLDPLATGVLPLLVGEATKLSPWLSTGDKEYIASLHLGVETDTLDSQGKVLKTSPIDTVNDRMVEEAFSRFQGTLRQNTPAYSAVKVQGVPLYEYARRGRSIVTPKREVTVFELRITGISLPSVEFSVKCSKGTFIRQLASDIGAALGCGAHVTSLRRTRSGPFSLAQALTLDTMESLAKEGTLSAHLISMSIALAGFPAISIMPEDADSLRRGRPLSGTFRGEAGLATGQKAKVVVGQGTDAIDDLVAIVESRGKEAPMKILRVFNATG